MKLPKWSGHLTAGILSLLAAFFGTFNVLFSDIFGVDQQAGAVLYVLAIYLVFSLLLHWRWPGRGWAWRSWLALPGLAGWLLITPGDVNQLAYPLLVLGAVAGGTWAGWFVFRRRAV